MPVQLWAGLNKMELKRCAYFKAVEVGLEKAQLNHE